MRDGSASYEGVRRVMYGDGATFIPVCSECGRFVKADAEIWFSYGGAIVDAPNATCTRCGRVEMLCEGFI